MSTTYGWQRFYDAAILETNGSCLPRLIQRAQAANGARIQQLHPDHQVTPQEQQAIADALAGLDILRKEIR
jgi:hypothetical protein